jgi:multimeric flavodoxin WrbA
MAESKGPKVLVLFYSTYGHCYGLAKAIAEGVKEGGGIVTIN